MTEENFAVRILAAGRAYRDDEAARGYQLHSKRIGCVLSQVAQFSEHD